MNYGVTHVAAVSTRWGISNSGPASVPLSKPGNTDGLSDWSVTSAVVAVRSLVGALCEKKAPLCGGVRRSAARICLGNWWGETKSWQCSSGTRPNRAAPFNGSNKTLLCHTLRNTVGSSVTTGHLTPLPLWNRCQHWSLFQSNNYPGVQFFWICFRKERAQVYPRKQQLNIWRSC